ncbi:MAG: radical SAM protein [Veillonella sp.]|uniref:Radical SAM protein n=1 Tax=Veillonella atypica TaxID=39777 RepID=A0AAJ1QB43_9FIRM|nr:MULTISPECIES: radical SAM protein [Veillonella]MDK7357641.1 radical SAM protein [Veillonella atypica]MDU4513228.1 radical SAM protein [Veillonella sp.]
MKYGMIPFFIPHVGCPHVCTFCNQSRITEVSGIGYLTPEYITSTIKDYVGESKSDKYWEVCFYGGSFSAINQDLQRQLLLPAYEALKEGRIDGIRCSTRPDAVSDSQLELLCSYGMKTIELGVQSMDDTVLSLAKRGHTSNDVKLAVKQLRKFGFTVGLQLLAGLLGDSWDTIIKTGIEIYQLQPDFVRIYPVLVIENTELAEQYKAGIYEPLSLEQALQYCSFLKTWFESHQITVIRTGLQSTEELDAGHSLLAGPYEPAMGELVTNEQWRQRLEHCLDEHTEYFNNPVRAITISYPRNLTSKVRGLKKRNLTYFEKTYGNITFTWRENNDIDTVQCSIDGMVYVV